jgi:hypothetical protein
MRGYPKYIATKQDLINLLAMPEYRNQAQADMKKIADVADDKVTRTISIAADGSAVTEEIINPLPLWKQKGFTTRKVLSALITKEAAADVILEEKPVEEGLSEEVIP